jgi:hypothetical protein
MEDFNMRYYIVYNNDKVIFYYDELIEDQFLATGLDNTFITEDKQEWIDKLKNDFNVDYTEEEIPAIPTNTEENEV